MIKATVEAPATLRSVRSICLLVRAFASDVCNDIQFVEQVEVGVAEAVNNIVKHGYKYDEHGVVTIAVTVESGSIKIVIRDSAPHFSPLADPPAEDVLYNLSKANEASLGMGRIIMREAMDSLEYRRLDHGNMLIMHKAIPGREGKKGCAE